MLRKTQKGLEIVKYIHIPHNKQTIFKKQYSQGAQIHYLNKSN